MKPWSVLLVFWSTQTPYYLCMWHSCCQCRQCVNCFSLSSSCWLFCPLVVGALFTSCCYQFLFWALLVNGAMGLLIWAPVTRGGSFFYSKLLNAIFLLKMNCLILDMAVCVCVYTRISINFSLSQQPKSISWKWIIFVFHLVSTCIFSHLNLSISDQILLSSLAPALISFPLAEIDHYQLRSTSTFTLLFHSKIYSVNHSSAWVCLVPVFLSLTQRKYVINTYPNVISS